MPQIAAKERRFLRYEENKSQCDALESPSMKEEPSDIARDREGASRSRSAMRFKYERYVVSRQKPRSVRRPQYDRLLEVLSIVADNQPSSDILAWVEQFGLEQEFERLADEWEQETRNISSPKRIAEHPNVQKIIDMGDVVIPLILKRMSHRPWFWFHALRQLAPPKSNPVTPEMRGNMQRMTEAWIKWGEDRGYV